MPDLLALFFLQFSHWIIIFPLLLAGLLTPKRVIFIHAIYLMLISILLNVALKVTFHIPLAAELGKAGFAFPSGHMQLSTVLYGWLAYNSKRPSIRLIVLLVLMGIGAALIHYHYHNLLDVTGGFFTGVLLICCYTLILYKRPASRLWLWTIITNLLIGYNYCYYTQVPQHACIAYYSLMSIIIIEAVYLYWQNKNLMTS